jgi:hypothetical protein
MRKHQPAWVVPALIVAAACGGSTTGGQVATQSTAETACARFFQVLFSHCETEPPSSEMTREQGRYMQTCTMSIGFPGVTRTAADLDACASAVESGGCNATQGPACADPAGTLPEGAACNIGLQCQSGSCNAEPEKCGTCSAPLAAGDPCLEDQCPPGMACSAGACVATSDGGEGAPCDGMVGQCGAGFFCVFPFGAGSPVCGHQGGQGATCRNSGDCQSSLVCVGTGAGTGTCQEGGANSACASDADCAPPLGCDGGKCAASLTWIQPGQPCSGAGDHCLVGQCTLIVVSGNETITTTSAGGPMPAVPMPPPGETVWGPNCPKTIADGHPCAPDDSTSMCDVFAECLPAPGADASTGTCVLTGMATCM